MQKISIEVLENAIRAGLTRPSMTAKKAWKRKALFIQKKTIILTGILQF